MNSGSKIAVTALVIVLFFVIGIFMIAGGVSKTFVGLLALGLFYGLKTMWKKPKEESSSEIKLDKTEDTDDENELTLKK